MKNCCEVCENIEEYTGSGFDEGLRRRRYKVALFVWGGSIKTNPELQAGTYGLRSAVHASVALKRWAKAVSRRAHILMPGRIHGERVISKRASPNVSRCSGPSVAHTCCSRCARGHSTALCGHSSSAGAIHHFNKSMVRDRFKKCVGQCSLPERDSSSWAMEVFRPWYGIVLTTPVIWRGSTPCR